MNIYTISNSDLELSVMDYGATIVSLKYKGTETVQRHESLDEYKNDGSYLCKTVGRYANRIGKSSFNLEGVEYTLTPNEGRNQLHGGPESYSERIWSVEEGSDFVNMSIFSPNGDNGFPGNLNMTVKFIIMGSTLRVEFEGECDKTTVFAPTVHPYFISDNAKMKLNCTEHVEVDDELIPTGRILKCEGKYDYTEMKAVSTNLDDAFVSPEEFSLYYESRDFGMEVWTDFPAVQVFSGRAGGVAIEPEFYPDSPNHKEFPDTTLHPGTKFNKYCEYRFK